MSNKEIRNIYPGEAVFIYGRQVNRAQTLGATSTINSENVNELGNFDIVEVVEDAPSVAITLDTNDHATITNVGLVAGKNPDMLRFLDLASFEDSEIDIVAPIIRGADYGKTGVDAAAGNLTIYRTMYIEKAFINSIELSYTTGGIATENFALESDNKRWFFNDSSNVIEAELTTDGSVEYELTDLTIATGLSAPDMQQLNDGSYTLGSDEDRIKRIRLINTSVVDATSISGYQETEYLYDGTYDSVPGSLSDVNFSDSTKNLFKIRQGSTNANTNRKVGIAISLQAAGGAVPTSGRTVKLTYTANDSGNYFTPTVEYVGGLRQGMIQIYLIPTLVDNNGLQKIGWNDYNIFWRVTSVTVSCPLTREALMELGHFRPYSRTVTFPVETSVAIESIDSDTEMFCKLTGKNFETVAGATGTEVSIDDFLEDLNAVVKLYRYTDVQRKKIKNLLENSGVNIYGWIEEESCCSDQWCHLPAYGGQRYRLNTTGAITGTFSVGEAITSASGAGTLVEVGTGYLVANVTSDFGDGETVSGGTSGAQVSLAASNAQSAIVDSCVVDTSGKYYFTHDLIPMKVVTVNKLAPTDEGHTLSVGSNATQSFSFKAYNWQMGIGGAAPQCLSVPTSGNYYVINSGSLDAWEYDLNNLSLKVNTGSSPEIDAVTHIDYGITGPWQAFKYGISLGVDTCDY